jgi:hypothetical protein
MPTVLLLRQLDAPFAAKFVGLIFPSRDDPLLQRQMFKGGEKCGRSMAYLEKIVIGLLGQGGGW